MAYETGPSRLLQDWWDEKANIQDFLADPLKWIAGELEKTYVVPLDEDDPTRRADWERVKTLVSIIRFVHDNKNLLAT